MEYLYGVLSFISRDLVCGAVNQLRYPCCFNTFVKELEEEEANLTATRNNVKDRSAHAKKQTRKTAEVVDKWLENADIDVESVKQLLEEARSKHNCCFGQCPNWIRRYNLGKKLANKKKELEGFIKEGGVYFQLERVATLPSGNADFSSEKYLNFGSRQKAYEKLMEAVKDDEVDKIGLYGMGGCGKTALAMEVLNKAEAEHLFGKVLFVPVSSTVEVRRIQDKIASSLQFTFPENEERERAQRLYMRLTQENKILVILDDVWEKLDFDSIGIPSTEHHNGCKVLITTRSQDVCNSMDCRKKIHLPILDDDEAWSLFRKEANINEDTSDTLKHLARRISDKCKGLPVAIVAFASTLKGKDEVRWEVEWSRLKSSKPVNIEKGLQDPYKCLELSYHHLDTEEAKSLFLLCSVFLEDYEIPIEVLARCAIGLGVVGEVGSYEEARKEVIAAKIKLVSRCLLLDASDDEYERVKMHNLVRGVAHSIAKNENKGIKCAVENDSTLEQNSVRYLWCEKLPNDLDCSNLEFLYVATKVEVLDEIFTRTGKLRVLCLFNEGGDRLPLSTMSFKTLKNLRCLILSYWELSDISFVRNMKKLESLTLNECSLPSFLDLQKDDAVAQLTKLKLLVLHQCVMKRNILEVIGRMPQLEELCIVDESEEGDDYSENTIEFYKTFSIPETLQRYTILFGSGLYLDLNFRSPPGRTLALRCFDKSNEAIMDLAKKAKKLYMGNIKGGAKNIIPNIFQFEEGRGMHELNELEIWNSKEIECLVDSSNHVSEFIGSFFSSLQGLYLENCPKLTSLLFTEAITPSNPGRYTIFQNIRHVKIIKCGELKYVFSANIVGGLPELESLYIEDCDKLEQIVEDINGSGAKELEIIEENTSTPSPPLLNHSPELEIIEENASTSSRPLLNHSPATCTGSFNLSKLTSVELRSCPKLVSLFPASTAKTLISLKELSIRDCYGLKHLLTCERDHNNKKQNSIEDDHDIQNLISMFLNLKRLVVERCDSLQHIFPVFPVGGQNNIGDNYFILKHLKELEIKRCAKLKFIFPMYVVRYLPELECLLIEDCKELRHVMEEYENDIIQTELKPYFPKLTVVIVEQCHKVKRLFSASTFDLPNLDVLVINEGNELEEFVEYEWIGTAMLSKLKLLILMHLPNFCQGIKLSVVEHRIINNCPKLSLTSSTTLEDLLYVNILDLDFANFGGLKRKLLSWMNEKKESEKYLSFGSRQNAYKELMEAVKDDWVGMIGLYGMGGCGKTTMAMEVLKKAEAEHLLDKVIFVPVSSTVEVRRIQDKIASSLQYTFPENEERERAQRLYRRLTQENKILVILDDVWEKLDFGAIGIPSIEHYTGCKVLITTRSEDVCTLNDCQKTVQLQILTNEDAWALFQKEAGISDGTSNTLMHMARQISDECKGLPVAIAPVARTLKGKDEVSWKVALNKLKSSKPVNIEKGLQDLYKCLELSYDNLDDEETKSLFLLCSVFPEDYEIPIEVLARCAIGLGVVGEVGSYEEARKEVIAAKIKLVSRCLLLDASDDDDEFVKMRDLVREVAHSIAKNENKSIKCAVENDSTLEQNSVRYLWCEKLPNDLDCSNLEFLYITTKVEVLDGIFTGAGKLRVLCLFNKGGDRLPLSTRSFKTLKNLRCLILSYWELSDISFVRDMKKLESLSLYRCSMPSFLDLQKDDAVAQLTKLKLLVLHQCVMKRNILEVIGRIPQLEELCIVDESEEGDDYSEFFKSFSVPQTLQRYEIKFGSLCQGYGDLRTELGTLSCSFFHISNEAIRFLAKNANILFIANIEGGAKNIIPNIFQFEEGGGMHELNELEIWNSKEIECLVDSSNHMSEVVGSLFSKLLKLCIYEMDDLRFLWHGGLPFSGTFRKLESLYLRDCPKLTSLFFTEAITPSNPVRYTIFQNLQQVVVIGCGELKYVFSTNVVGGLPQLQMLEIWDCNQLEQIVEDIILPVTVLNYPLPQHDRRQELGEIIEENTLTPSPPLGNHSPGSFILSKLTSLLVVSCPKLGSLFSASSAKTLTSLEKLSIKYCNGLKHLLTCEHENKKQNSVGREVSLVLETLELVYLPQMTCIWVASKSSFNIQHLKTLRIHGCAKLRVIFPLAVVRCLPELEYLEIEECKELKYIMEEDENDTTQKELKPCFPKLKKVIVGKCYKLKRLFFISASNDLPNLEDLIIYDADELEYLFGFEQGASKNSFTLQHLKTLTIKECAKLEVIFPLSVVRCLTELKCLEIEECKELKRIMEEDENDRIQRELKPCFPKQKNVAVGLCYKLKRHFSTSASNDLPNLEGLVIYEADEQGASKNSFTLQHLTTLKIKKCAKLEMIFPLAVVSCLPELEHLEIRECKEIEQIMQRINKLSNIVSSQPCFPKLKEVLVIRCHKLKHLFSTFASNDLPNLECLIINGADELEELIRCEERNDKEIRNVKAKLPKLKLLILMHLPNLCQEIESHAVKHSIINNCPRLSLPSPTTLQELCENLVDSDFKNMRLPQWELQTWLLEINKSNEFSETGGTSEFPSHQINEELEKKFIGEVRGPKVHATATSINSELNGRLSSSPLDVYEHKTHSKNIKIGAEEGTASENAMMVSSHLESTNSQLDSSQHKSYAREWDSEPENTSPLQMNQEHPSTSKNEFFELETKSERTPHLQSLEQKLPPISSPNMTELVDKKSNNEESFLDQHVLGETMINEELEKKFIGEVHGPEVYATTTSTNSELNGRLSSSPLDVCEHKTHSKNIKIDAEERTTSENAIMVSSHLESTSSQPDSSQHKSYACEWDSEPENTFPLQMNQEHPSTSKSKSPSSQVNDNSQSIPGSIAEMVHKHKLIQNEAPVSETCEFFELDTEIERTSHLQSFEQKLPPISSPNMTELVDEKSSNEAGFLDQHVLGETMNFEEIGEESIQEESVSEGAIVKTFSTGVESISLGSGVATQSESGDEDIATQHSQLIDQDDMLIKSKKRIQIQEESNLMDKKERICMGSSSNIEVPLDTHTTRLRAYKHFVDLDDEQIAMLAEATIAYPHLWNSCEKFREHFQAWMLKTLADMLSFLRNESVLSVTPQRENEFSKLCDEAVQLGFEKSWVDEMRQRVVARDPELDHAQAQISELLKRHDHLTQELCNIQNELKSLNDFVDAQTKCFDFL